MLPASRSLNSPKRFVVAMVRSCSRWPLVRALVHLRGLGVDEVGGELTGVPAEQDVRQRHVAPEEADQVQAGQQHDHGVQQPSDRVGTHALGEQRAVGQRELQVPGDQHRVERLAVSSPAGR